MKRIASFLASGTEIVVALGLQESIVAISHECDWPPDVLDRPRLSRPRFDPAGMDSGEIDSALRAAMAEHGSVYVVDEELLARLKPDIVLTQAVCEVCAVPTPGVRALVERQQLGADVVSLDAHTVQDILDSIVQVGAATGAEGQAADVVAELSARLHHVRTTAARAANATHAANDTDTYDADTHDTDTHDTDAEAPHATVPGRPRVLALEWLDPPFAPGHWVPELIEMAGGENLAGAAGAHSTEISWDDLRDLNPDVLIIMPCGYDLAATRADADRSADRLLAVAPRAVAAGRAFIVDGSAYFNRSGPRFVTGVEILAGLLHPSLFPAPPADTAAVWRGSN
jgi:iron complex transport system substrate-binding protein